MRVQREKKSPTLNHYLSTDEQDFGKTSLHEVAQNGSAHSVGSLLEKQSENINKQDFYGHTPVHIALLSDNLEAAALFAQHPSLDPNLKEGYFGRTPLHIAAVRSGSIIPKLIEQGARINESDNMGLSPALLAILNDRLDNLEILMQNGAIVPEMYDETRGMTLLHWAAEKGKLNLVNLLLKKESLIDPIDKSGKTPLESAFLLHKDCQNKDHCAIISALIHHGAQLKKITERYLTAYENKETMPLSIAEFQQRIKAIKTHYQKPLYNKSLGDIQTKLKKLVLKKVSKMEPPAPLPSTVNREQRYYTRLKKTNKSNTPLLKK